MITKKNFFILTGGPGSGKTTLINYLQDKGYNCVPEVGRKVIRDQIAVNGSALPWDDAKKYAALMLLYSIQDYTDLSESTDVYFFDRGIPDTLGYERLMNFSPGTELIQSVKNLRYNPVVFILPPWEEIYQIDNERKQDFKVAIDTYNVMISTYKDVGYTLVDLPRVPVAQRVDTILEKVKVDMFAKPHS